ncbi:MAG: hypothetical protein HYU64_20665 [Armatimonadetes bacterium]|nr:hypothetical protein [Armatimonadota bacterium]
MKPDSPTATSYRVLLGLGKAYGNLEGVEVAEYAFQHILEREEEIRDPEVVIRAIGALGEIQAKRGELEAALDLFGQAIQKADSARNALLASEMGINKAQVLLRLGRQPEAFSLLDRAEEVFKIWKDHHQLARSLLARASAVPEVGPDSHFSRCLDLVKKYGNSDFFTQEMGLARPLLVDAFMAGLHEDFVPSILRRAGPEAVPMLVKKMPQKGSRTVKTIKLLGEMGGKEAEAALRAMVGNPAQETRDAVRAALEKIQERGLVEKLKIVMFGPFQVQRGEVLIPQEVWTMKKAKSLLAYLVIHRDRQVPEDKVCDVFWPSLDAEKARNNLHTTVYKLRRTLEPHLAGGMASQYILYQRGFYRFNPDSNYWIDLEAFEEHCSEAEKAKSQGDSESAVRHFRQAASLYGGEFLEGLEEEWCIYQRVTLQQKYFDILVQISEQMCQTSLHQEAVEAARKILDVDRSYEKAHCLIMRSFALLGKRDEAIRQYHQCADILKKELGLSPSPETEALYLKIIDRVL